MYVYCVESFAHIECYNDCSRRGEPFGWTPLLRCCLLCVVPSLWSVVFCTYGSCVCLVCLLLCKEKGSSPVSLQLMRGGI